MHSNSVPLSDRLRTWSWTWPWLPALVLVVILGSLIIYWMPHQERLEKVECTRLYRGARTLSDTLAVDARVPFNEVGNAGMTCGRRRKLGLLH